MITAYFFRKSDNTLVGFSISGHAGMGEYGKDIACASVSSAVMLTVNTMTEAFHIKAKTQVLENDISLKLEDYSEEGDKLLLGLLTHMYMLKEEFPQAVTVKIIDR